MYKRGLDAAIPQLDGVSIIPGGGVCPARCDRQARRVRRIDRNRQGFHCSGLKLHRKFADIPLRNTQTRLEPSDVVFVLEYNPIRWQSAAASDKYSPVFAKQSPLGGVIADQQVSWQILEERLFFLEVLVRHDRRRRR